MADKQQAAMQMALSKAKRIGPPTSIEQTLDNPSGLMPMAGMVGGLPNGLNPQAISELLKRMNIPEATDTMSKIVPHASNTIRQSLDEILPMMKNELFNKYIKNFIK